MDSKKQLELYIKPALWKTIVTWSLLAVVVLSIAVGFVSLNSKGDIASAAKYDPYSSGTSKGSYAYIDVVLVSSWMYDVDNGQQVYYSAMDADGQWYVIRLSKTQFSEMSAQYNYFNDENAAMPKPYRIYGLVQNTDTDLRGAVSSYWALSVIEYPQFFGATYLNATSSPSGERSAIMFVVAMFAFIMFIVFIATIAGPLSTAKKNIKRLAELGEIDNAAYELIDPANESINLDKIRFSRNYLFVKGTGTAVKYGDIAYCYNQTVINQGAITTFLFAQTATAKKLILFSIRGYDNAGFTQRAIEIISERNPTVRLDASFQ